MYLTQNSCYSRYVRHFRNLIKSRSRKSVITDVIQDLFAHTYPTSAIIRIAGILQLTVFTTFTGHLPLHLPDHHTKPLSSWWPWWALVVTKMVLFFFWFFFSSTSSLYLTLPIRVCTWELLSGNVSTKAHTNKHRRLIACSLFFLLSTRCEGSRAVMYYLCIDQ